MEEKSIQSLIDYLPLDGLEREIVELVSSGKSEEELIEALIKRFEK
tara:strand:- start:153 stop:290 length:138 start_codon:yes stop_codon:yes gene_type:complete